MGKCRWRMKAALASVFCIRTQWCVPGAKARPATTCTPNLPRAVLIPLWIRCEASSPCIRPPDGLEASPPPPRVGYSNPIFANTSTDLERYAESCVQECLYCPCPYTAFRSSGKSGSFCTTPDASSEHLWQRARHVRRVDLSGIVYQDTPCIE